MNLAGFFWLHWASEMKNDEKYQPVWLYRIHLLYMIVSVVLLVLLFTPYRDNVRMSYWGNTIENPSLGISLTFMFILMSIFAIPFLAREEIKDNIEIR